MSANNSGNSSTAEPSSGLGRQNVGAGDTNIWFRRMSQPRERTVADAKAASAKAAAASPQSSAVSSLSPLEILKEAYLNSPSTARDLCEAAGLGSREHLVQTLIHVPMEDILAMMNDDDVKDLARIYRLRDSQALLGVVFFIRTMQSNAKRVLFTEMFPELTNGLDAFPHHTVKQIAWQTVPQLQDALCVQALPVQLVPLLTYLKSLEVDAARAAELAYSVLNPQWAEVSRGHRNSPSSGKKKFVLHGYSPVNTIPSPSKAASTTKPVTRLRRSRSSAFGVVSHPAPATQTAASQSGPSVQGSTPLRKSKLCDSASSGTPASGGKRQIRRWKSADLLGGRHRRHTRGTPERGRQLASHQSPVSSNVSGAAASSTDSAVPPKDQGSKEQTRRNRRRPKLVSNTTKGNIRSRSVDIPAVPARSAPNLTANVNTIVDRAVVDASMPFIAQANDDAVPPSGTPSTKRLTQVTAPAEERTAHMSRGSHASKNAKAAPRGGKNLSRTVQDMARLAASQQFVIEQQQQTIAEMQRTIDQLLAVATQQQHSNGHALSKASDDTAHFHASAPNSTSLDRARAALALPGNTSAWLTERAELTKQLAEATQRLQQAQDNQQRELDRVLNEQKTITERVVQERDDLRAALQSLQAVARQQNTPNSESPTAGSTDNGSSEAGKAVPSKTAPGAGSYEVLSAQNSTTGGDLRILNELHLERSRVRSLQEELGLRCTWMQRERKEYIAKLSALYALLPEPKRLDGTVPESLDVQAMQRAKQELSQHRPFLGLQLDGKETKGTTAGSSSSVHGVVILRVMPGSAAYRCGLRGGDAVESINGVACNSFSQIMRLIASLVVGSTACLQVRRGNQVHLRQLVIPAAPDDAMLATSPHAGQDPQSQSKWKSLYVRSQALPSLAL